MRRILWVAAVVYIVLSGGIVVLAFLITSPLQNSWDEFAKLVGIGLTLLSSLMAAVMSPLLTVRQQLHLGLRAGLLEAYRHLYSAATYAYRMIAPLETGDWSLDRFRAAEECLASAEGYAFYLPDDQEELWQEIGQAFRYISETAEKDSSSPEERIALWRREAPALADLIYLFKAKVRGELAKR